jgi:Uma2 family endonuclease
MDALLHLDAETLPEAIVWNPPLSDEGFEALCFENDSVKLERTKEGRILMHAPASDDTSSANSEIIRQLGNWWDAHGRGRVYDSNSGFFLPDTSMLSPDAAYVIPERLGPRSERGAKLARRCPDFVIELLSPSDSLRKAQAKMHNWISNGASLGWLIDPRKRRVTIYSPDKSPVHVSGEFVEGSGPVQGFTLNLGKVWRFYES